MLTFALCKVKVRFEPIVTTIWTREVHQMKTNVIDISGCQTAADVFDRILEALDAPGWHGRNLDALWDSITSDINGVLPPYTLTITGRELVPEAVALLLSDIQTVFEDARKDRCIEVLFRLD